MHEQKCFIDAYEWLHEIRKDVRNFAKFDESLKTTLIDILNNLSKESLKTYGPPPLSFCDMSRARLFSLLKPYIDFQMEKIKHELENKEKRDINFSWGQYEQAYEIARRNWQGILAVKYSRFLSLSKARNTYS